MTIAETCPDDFAQLAALGWPGVIVSLGLFALIGWIVYVMTR